MGDFGQTFLSYTSDQHCYTELFFQLRLLRWVLPLFSPKDRAAVVAAVINIHLDYCDTLYAGLTESPISTLQVIRKCRSSYLGYQEVALCIKVLTISPLIVSGQ